MPNTITSKIKIKYEQTTDNSIVHHLYVYDSL